MIEGPYRTRSSFNPDSWLEVVFAILGALFLAYSVFFYYSNALWSELVVLVILTVGGAGVIFFGNSKRRIVGLVLLTFIGIGVQAFPEPPIPISKYFSR
jgi:hypothetical protein